MQPLEDRTISRRDLLGMSLGAGAALALTPALLGALRQQHAAAGKLIQRAIPSSGEMLPVISFGARPVGGAALKAQPADAPTMKEVLKAFIDNGGKVVDVLHGGPAGEQGARAAASELGIQDKLFWTTPLGVSVPLLPGHTGPTPRPDPADVKAAMEAKFAQFNAPTIDLVQVLAHAEVATHLAVLREMKKEGRIRYIGVTDLLPPPNMPPPPDMGVPRLESIMRSEEIDFIGVDYSVGDRRIEQTLLPLAQERKIGVMAYFPFDRSRIFKRATSTPLPEWAAEFDAKTWAQFFLKYVLGHPAVIVARTGTTKPAHMLDNIGGGIGRLPDEAMRKRMAEFVDSLPPTPPPGPPKPQGPQGPQAPQPPAITLSAAILDRYAGTYKYAAAGTIVTVRRDGDKLLVKPGAAPEGPLVARSEMRFTTPWGAPLEFQLDPQGKVTGAVVEQGPHRIQLERQ